LRDTLIQRGRERLNLFRPARMGQRMLEIFRSMVA